MLHIWRLVGIYFTPGWALLAKYHWLSQSLNCTPILDFYISSQFKISSLFGDKNLKEEDTCRKKAKELFILPWTEPSNSFISHWLSKEDISDKCDFEAHKLQGTWLIILCQELSILANNFLACLIDCQDLSIFSHGCFITPVSVQLDFHVCVLSRVNRVNRFNWPFEVRHKLVFIRLFMTAVTAP